MTNRYSEMVVSVLLVLLWSVSAFGAPMAVPYNGYLTDSDGKAFQGNVSVVAELYEDFEGGEPATTCTYSSLKVDSGIVSFVMGEGCTPPLDTTLFHPDGMWLSVTINGTTLEPRQEVLSVPYALSSEDSANLGGFPAEDYLMVSELAEGGYLTDQDVSGVCMSGDWKDLGVKPDLSVYLKVDGTVALAGPWDLDGQALSNVVIGASETPPEGAAAGQLWWDSGAGSLKVYTGESWVLVSAAEGVAVAADLDCVECVSQGELGFELAGVATSGAYEDLSGAPDLAGYALTANLQPVCITGSYQDLVDLDLSAFVILDNLAAVALSGDYDDLSNVPDLSGCLLLGDLALVAGSGAYQDLSGKPDFSLYLQVDGSVGLSGDLDVAKHRLLNVAVDASGQAPAGPVAGQLWYDGSGKVLRVWTGMEWLGLGSGAGALPKDGLSAISNGTLTNELSKDYAAAGLPEKIGVSKDVVLEISDGGSLADLELSFSLTHPFCAELSIRLLPPGDDLGILLVKAGDIAGQEYSGLFGIVDALPAGGTFQPLLGSEQSGTWLLRVTDTVQNGNEDKGEIASFALSVTYLALNQVQVNADQTVSGDVAVSGKLTVGDTDVAAELLALKGEVWCLKNCDPAKIGNCQDLTCDGLAQTCEESGALPDGTACQGGAGTCMAGECCVPLSCFLMGAVCGEADDGCGGWLDCGLCQNPEAVCFENQCCVPETCDSLGKECDDWEDGCGEMTGECGPCLNGHECGDGGQCDGPWVGIDCGGLACPELAGYTLTCNGKEHCEYANEDDSGWRQWDVWIYIAPGSFQMGSPDNEDGHQGNESPVHPVTIGYGYFISKYEIVVEEYEACNAAEPGKCTTPSTVDWNANDWGTNYWADETDGNNVLHKRLDHPQNGLTWQQAKDFCGWVAPNGRLPSEAEWEYAATGPVHIKYPWGDSPDPTCDNDTAVFNEDGGVEGYGCGNGGTASVGSKTAGASWCGALDMSGNLWEWNEDWYHSSYTNAPDDGSAWVDPNGSNRVLRGGGFSTAAVYMRAAQRNDFTPGYRYANNGGRCLRSLP
jgi:formylglycine-generating enzyme required for sulfatase activity/subtilisin-like proprotein convertase family protein